MKEEDISNLVDKYGSCIYGFCRRLAYNKEDAEDLYQQTYLRALELCDKIDENKNPKGFLISIAIKHWKNQISKKVRRQKLLTREQNNSDFQIESIPDSNLLEDEVQNRFLYKQVAEIVDLLPDKYKIPVIMYYTAEISFPDIAQVLKLPQGTVKSRMHKARSIIKEKLEAYGYEKI